MLYKDKKIETKETIVKRVIIKKTCVLVKMFNWWEEMEREEEETRLEQENKEKNKFCVPSSEEWVTIIKKHKKRKGKLNNTLKKN